MKVYIDEKVHWSIEQFYLASVRLHESLDRATVLKKIDRLYDAIWLLGCFPNIYPAARVKRSWVMKGYREMICEDFHFAFSVITLADEEQVVYVCDAVHSKLNF